MNAKLPFKSRHWIFLCLFASTLTQADVMPTEPILRIDTGDHVAVIRRIASDDAGRWLATASDDKTVRVWDLSNNGRLVSTLRPPIGLGNIGKLNAVAMSPDGKLVATGGWTDDSDNSAYLFDRASGRMIHRLLGLPNVVNHLAFSPDNRLIAVSLTLKHGIRLMSAATGKVVAEDKDYGGASFSAHFSRDGRLITSSEDGYVRIYRYSDNSLTLISKEKAAGGTDPGSTVFSNDGRRVAVGFYDKNTISVLDGGNLSLRYSPDITGAKASMQCTAWSNNDNWLYAAGSSQSGDKRFIRRWSASDSSAGSYVDWPVSSDTIMFLSPLPGDKVAFSTGEPSWGVMNASGEKVIYHGAPVVDFRSNYEGFKLSRNATQVRFGYLNYGKDPVVFDVQRRAFLSEDAAGLYSPVISTSALTVTNWKNYLDPKLNDRPLTLKSNERSRSIAMRFDSVGFVLGTEWRLRAFDGAGKQVWEKPVPGSAWGVNTSQDGRWVVASYSDGTIRWHRVSDGQEQLALYPSPDRKRWVMWTPTGYYDASPGAEDLIGWHVNNGKDQAADFFPASRFRDRFYRPDVISKVLDLGTADAALQQSNQETGRREQTQSITEVLPPVITILSPPGMTVSSTTVKIKYSVRSPSNAPVTSVRVRINGQAVTVERGLARKDSNADPVREIEVKIPEADSEIALFAENNNGVSVAGKVNVVWGGARSIQPEETLFKPKLYVLAVGVSKYKNADYNLGLASKDARDFAAVLQKQKGRLYGDVVVKLLTDENAGKDDVLDGLEWLKSQVTSRDVGIMFLAGHGLNDNSGNYYFLPHNVNTAQLLRTGVAQNDIKITLNSLAGKAIFFVDTCHSGNALGSAKTRGVADTNGIVNDLSSAENGVVVFAASTGKQSSQEDPAWGNGAFTKAVVEGLSGKADFGNRGKITHKGLDYYVAERVKELTHGQQSPVSIAPNGVADFPIAITGK